MDGLPRVGIVGTGYAARRRAEALQALGAELVAVSGGRDEVRADFAGIYGCLAIAAWQELVTDLGLDLVMVCGINREHGAIARAALEAGKHVVVEYPLALDPEEGAALIALAKERGKLLHVEHIELLGGLHHKIREYLPQIGRVYYARYVTLSPKRQVLPHWTYCHEDYGFPLVAALSRVNRLLDLFGEVRSLSGEATFWDSEWPGYYRACLCSGQLRFADGLIAELVYGKGDMVHQGDRTFTIYGDEGTLVFSETQGQLIQGDRVEMIELGDRRGAFRQDTAMVLDHLQHQTPLYITPEQSLYALKIADILKQSASTDKPVILLKE